MSDPTLPDLPVDEVALCGYYNLIHHGGLPNDKEFDETKVTNADRAIISTYWDNGVEGEFDGFNGSTLKFRVKDDGWVIIWYEDHALDAFNETGVWNLIPEWKSGFRGGWTSIKNNNLERAIRTMLQELSVWDLIQYEATDVGLFSFAFPQAKAITYSGYNGYRTTESLSATYTDETQVLMWYMPWKVRADKIRGTPNSAHVSLTIRVKDLLNEEVKEQTVVSYSVSQDNHDVTKTGVENLIERGLVGGSAFQYDFICGGSGGGLYYTSSHRISNLVMWT